jgi:hypothetical protein
MQLEVQRVTNDVVPQMEHIVQRENIEQQESEITTVASTNNSI